MPRSLSRPTLTPPLPNLPFPHAPSSTVLIPLVPRESPASLSPPSTHACTCLPGLLPVRLPSPAGARPSSSRKLLSVPEGLCPLSARGILQSGLPSFVTWSAPGKPDPSTGSPCAPPTPRSPPGRGTCNCRTSRKGTEATFPPWTEALTATRHWAAVSVPLPLAPWSPVGPLGVPAGLWQPY